MELRVILKKSLSYNLKSFFCPNIRSIFKVFCPNFVKRVISADKPRFIE